MLHIIRTHQFSILIYLTVSIVCVCFIARTNFKTGSFKMVRATYLLLNALVLVFVSCCTSLRSVHGGTNETADKLALLAIKAQIHQDPNRPVMSSWNDSTHFCMWHGVTCNRRHLQRVTKLNLTSLKLSGSISPHIGNLSFLRDLVLDNNSFTGKIPPEVGRLQRLRKLILTDNSLSGFIPSNISYCSNLFNLHLYRNKLVGNIPSEIGFLSKLSILDLGSNILTGEVPPSLGNISSLETLAIDRNKLVGSIPSSLGQLNRLTILELSTNTLSGTIPPSIYNISSLLLFSIGDNQIHGSLPPSLFETLLNLQCFDIFQSKFTGSLPISMCNATNLVWFQVNSNKLSGQVPNLQKLHKLTRFSIFDNHLGRASNGDLSFFSGLTNATQLEWLMIHRNNFGGTLPISLSNLSTNLERLSVHENQLEGTIPQGIENLIHLKLLSMQNNMFKGNIPTSIGKLSGIGLLDLSTNKLSGSLPSSLGNLTMLSKLFLQGNYFGGNIPTNLGNCRSLQYLDLSHNKLTGGIPPQVLVLPSLSIYLNLSENRLSSSLPLEVGKLQNLGKLDLSNNILSGNLPGSLGSCVNLEVLRLQGNFFDGLIPSTMESLKGIRDLDVSRNNFTGEVPEFLAGFKFLERLNMSFNDFWGLVPTTGVFNNASVISIVGNARLCGGISNLQLPECKSKVFGSRKLRLIIYLVFGFTLLGIVMLLTLLFICRLKKKEQAAQSSTLVDSSVQVSYNDLLKATDGFSATNLIGAGSFGSVYKGLLEKDEAFPVAVKVFNMLRKGASKSFIAECEALRNIRHRNLVKIMTACSSIDFGGNDFKALVYEFMENGSLEEWLHPKEEVPKILSLAQRLDIAIDVACALDYLHNDCETPIVHCDLKPSNVLLDKDLSGYVSDFGLAKFLSRLAGNVSSNHSSSIGIRGSVGYVAPEYGMGSEVSTHGDVYSFGILLLEIFTGKKPTDHMFIDSLNIHNFVKMAFPERVVETVDASLLQVGNSGHNANEAHKIEECLSSILGIGVACSVQSPIDRMFISDVVSELKIIRDTLLG